MKVRVVIRGALYPHRRQTAQCSVQWTILNNFFSQTEQNCLPNYVLRYFYETGFFTIIHILKIQTLKVPNVRHYNPLLIINHS